MDELQNFAQYGWGGAAVLVMVLLLLIFRKRERKEDDAKAKAREHYNAYIATLHDWQDAIEHGDGAAAAEYAQAAKDMHDKGWHIAPIVAAVLASALLCGCASRMTEAAPPPEPVVLTEHARVMSPGDTLPDLPSGEGFWWVCTPTGLRRLLPSEVALAIEAGGKEPEDVR